jgi:ABC-type transport system involved in multi-copper enzyme maturation permease subunit
LATLAIHGAVSILLAIANAKGLNSGVGGMTAVMALSGPVTMGVSTAELLGEPVDLARSATTLCWYNTIYSLAITAVVFLALVVRLRRVMLKDAGSAVTVLTRRQKRKMSRANKAGPPAGASAEESPVAVGVPAEEVEHTSREVGDRPVLWRELAQPAFRSRWRLALTILVLAGLLIYLNIEMESSQERHGANMMIMGLGLAIMLLLGSGAASSAIPQERESRTLDVLMTTPLSAREIILGKFWGAMRRQWFLPSVLLIHLLLSGVLGSTVPLVALVHVSVVIVASLAFLSAVGIWMSVKSKKSVGASVRTALIGLGVWLLPFPAAALMQSLASVLGWRREGEWFLSLAAVINPVFLGAGSLKIPSMWDSNGRAYFLPEPMFEGNVGFTEFTAVLAIVMGGYLVLAWLVLQRARIVLGRQTNRSR